MQPELNNLERVIFEHADGTQRYIDGEELKKWVEFNKVVSQIAQIHEQNPRWESVKWKEIENVF